MTSLFPTKKVENLLSRDRGISVGVMYPGKDTPAGVPLIRAGDIKLGVIDPTVNFRISREVHQEYRRTALEGGELLITLVGSPGVVATVPVHMAGWNAARAIAVVRLNDPSDAAYFKAAFGAPNVQHMIKNVCNTTVQATLNLKEIRALELPWPEKPYRDQIAAVLGALDDKIELNRKTAATLEAMARALYRSWFVDFDPVHAKAAGRAPAHMDAATAALFPDRFGEDGLPEGWRLGTLQDIAISPRTGVKPDQIDPSTPYIGLEHMPRKSIALTDWGVAEQIGSQKSGMCAGDFLFAKLRPYFHKVGVSPVDGICSTDIIVVRPQSEAWGAIVLSVISSEDFVEHTNASSSGTRMPRTNWRDMARYEVVVPPAPIAQTFNDIVCPMLDQINRDIHENQTLATLRDTLLPRLMSGELRVGAAREQVEEAV